MQDYRKLRVWHESHALVLKVRKVVDRFPRNGYGPLKLQIVRAAESVPTNIVEGCGATSQKDFARFLEISIRSSNELEYQLLLSHDYGIARESDFASLSKQNVDIRKGLCRLRDRVIESESDAQQETQNPETHKPNDPKPEPDGSDLETQNPETPKPNDPEPEPDGFQSC